MKIAITGHRPNKLWGYNYYTEKYLELGRQIRNILIENNATHIISGMALGVDTIYALVGLKLKRTIMPKLVIECAIPCLNHSSKWLKSSVDLYNKILRKANIITYVSEQNYTTSCMQKRNEYMVNNCDLLIAVWDGTAGGTKNCIDYAKRVGKQIIYINPKQI